MAKKKSAKRTSSATTAPKQSKPDSGASTQFVPLDALELDGDNPRLGADAGRFKNQTEILDAIVNIFGVDDVLSSLAVSDDR